MTSAGTDCCSSIKNLKQVKLSIHISFTGTTAADTTSRMDEGRIAMYSGNDVIGT
jgi:hypothetical protein